MKKQLDPYYPSWLSGFLRTCNWVAVGSIGVVIVTAGATIYQEQTHEWVCTDVARVKAITAVNYRTAYVLMDDGRVVTFSQATLKPGDSVCLNQERREKK